MFFLQQLINLHKKFYLHNFTQLIYIYKITSHQNTITRTSPEVFSIDYINFNFGKDFYISQERINNAVRLWYKAISMPRAETQKEIGRFAQSSFSPIK